MTKFQNILKLYIFQNSNIISSMHPFLTAHLELYLNIVVQEQLLMSLWCLHYCSKSIPATTSSNRVLSCTLSSDSLILITLIDSVQDY
jgi:hypothetical protein